MEETSPRIAVEETSPRIAVEETSHRIAAGEISPRITMWKRLVDGGFTMRQSRYLCG